MWAWRADELEDHEINIEGELSKFSGATTSAVFAAIDEGGLSYLAKVLELAVVTTMNSALFGREFSSENSLFYSGTIELIGEILELEASV